LTHVQNVFQAAIPHIVQQILEQKLVLPLPISPSSALQRVNQAPHKTDRYCSKGFNYRELKVIEPKKFSSKKAGKYTSGLPSFASFLNVN